ncbi:hypothetical protein GCM10010497_58920 [Streptomyces cinereoruber]|uniref:Uncharacterized protein n=1 Tax=Streptomyces cinereoruber TaxID=67260 RepID=A0AAV4KU09_9ACTN|nr:hypothetical protein GCM10010497_58920 [Streptomyces cinereoruber]
MYVYARTKVTRAGNTPDESGRAEPARLRPLDRRAVKGARRSVDLGGTRRCAARRAGARGVGVLLTTPGGEAKGGAAQRYCVPERVWALGLIRARHISTG